MSFTQHPLSSAFPAMSADDYQSLKDSIDNIGVQNPITLFEGMVIDGWHRYSAANDLGMDCPSVELGDVDPRDFVLAQNKARRHVTQAQLGMAVTAVYAWKPHGDQRSTLNVDRVKSTAEMASIAGVHPNTITQAKTVQSQGTPEVQAAVKSGAIGLPKAAAIAKLPQAEQAAAIHKPAPKPASPAPPPAPVVEPEAEDPPEYTALDAAHDQINELQADLVVARMGDIPEEQKTQAAERIAALQAEINTLTATLAAVQLSRDSLMEERVQMLRQLKAQRNQIDRLKANK